MAKKKNIQLSKEEIENSPHFVLPIRNTVIFPGVLIPVTIARKNSIELVNFAFEKKLVRYSGVPYKVCVKFVGLFSVGKNI